MPYVFIQQGENDWESMHQTQLILSHVALAALADSDDDRVC